MSKRKFYDWRYNTPAAVAERRQQVIARTALERRKRKALKAAEIEHTLAGPQFLQSDAFLKRFENSVETSKRSPPKSATEKLKISANAAETPETTTAPLRTEEEPHTSADFQTELALIKKMKISKHDKGVKINLLKRKYQVQGIAQTQIAAERIQKSDKHRVSQTKRIQKKKRSGQLKLSGASTVLLQRLHKTLKS